MIKEQELSGYDRCQKSALRMDVYRQPFRLLLPDGHDTYRTLIGSLLSLLTFVTLLMYGSYKVTRLVQSEDYKVSMHVLEDHFASNETFGSTDGFVVAAAMTRFDGSNEDITDPEIGEIRFYLKHWDVDDPSYNLNFTELETKVCQSTDFNYNNGSSSANEKALFYPVKLQS